MTVQEIKQSYGTCGLVCAMCSGNTDCPGCRCKEGCAVRDCCVKKGLDYCFTCPEWPCEKDMHKGIRTRVFNAVAREEGLDKLAAYLYSNYTRGIAYHRADGLPGDYDRCKTREEVASLLKNGKPDPYEVCPTYESLGFILRLVSREDAEDLLECYKNPTSSVQASSVNCVCCYGAQTLKEMEDSIDRWLWSYGSREFIRFSVIDKQSGKAVGTVEILSRGYEGHGFLRVDTLPAYENEACLCELLALMDAFFYDMENEGIVTRVDRAAGPRISALIANGYAPYPAKPSENERYGLFMKRRPQL